MDTTTVSANTRPNRHQAPADQTRRRRRRRRRPVSETQSFSSSSSSFIMSHSNWLCGSGVSHHQCTVSACSKVFLVILSLVCLLITKSSPRHGDNTAARYFMADAFHLSFAHRLVKSIHSNTNSNSNNNNQEQLAQHQYSSVNPLLNPPENLIRPIECRNANNHSEVGICMFSIDCMQNKGVPLSICKHNYFVGTCCRLPDYNNFVGIVYDLRETETSSAVSQQQALEARRGSSDALHIFKSSSTTTERRPDGSDLSTTTRPAQDIKINNNNYQTDSSAALQQQQQQQSPQSLTSATKAPVDSNPDTSSKYLISSTKLFAPAGSSAGPQAQQQQSSSSSLPSTTTSKPGQFVEPIPVQSASETARNNADNPAIQSPSQIVFGSLNDDPQTVHNSTNMNSAYELLATSSSSSSRPGPSSASSPSPSSLVQQLAHDDQAAAGQQQTIVISSAHSATASSDPSQAQAQQHQQSGGKSGAPALDESLQAELASSAHSSLRPAASLETTATGSSVTFFTSNHHQADSSGTLAMGATSPSSTGTTLSDQEFTLSTGGTGSGSTSQHTPDGSSQPQSVHSSEPPSIKLTTGSSQSSDSRFETSQQQQQSNSSPFVDLVSSSSSLLASTDSSPTSQQQETTTPFTSSLSTAILPSISSHPYAPTTTPPSSPNQPTALPSSSPSSPQLATLASSTLASSSQVPILQQQQQQQPTQTLVSNSTSTSTTVAADTTSGSSSSGATSSTSSSPQSSTGHETSGASSSTAVVVQSTTGGSGSGTPQFVAQYYSTAAAPIDPLGLGQQHHLHQQHHNHYHNHHRPLAGSPGAGLQVASKIVTGNSAANNLIPGLSGLQSAILAHIPFKIASGLSSGLSSYLQAAMKPSGQLPPGRPLISSNTAPALQYQQQQQQQQQLGQNQTGAGKPAGSGAQMSAVRFPTASSPSPSEPSSLAPVVMVAGAGAAQQQQQHQHQQQQLQRDVSKEAQLVCGRPRVSELKTNKRVARIVGGNQSAFGQWPWMVSLRQWRKGAFLHKCGAALLNENWAITAAHCVENVKAPDLLLRLGEFDVSNQNEPFPYIERHVRTVVSHPSFDPKTFEYDLALIRFTEPIQYERNIIPVCVPQGNDSYVDRMATVIGWGRLFEDGPLPDVIQHVDVPIITNQECEKMYKSAGFVEEIPDMFICAGISKGGRDSCEGDSGGPLTMIDHDGRSYLVGIISWGIGCALPSQPGVYTRITAFSPWINQIIST